MQRTAQYKVGKWWNTERQNLEEKKVKRTNLKKNQRTNYLEEHTHKKEKTSGLCPRQAKSPGGRKKSQLSLSTLYA